VKIADFFKIKASKIKRGVVNLFGNYLDRKMNKAATVLNMYEDKEAYAFLNEYEERDKVLDTKTDLQKHL